MRIEHLFRIPHSTLRIALSCASEIRTHNHRSLRPAAQAVGVPHKTNSECRRRNSECRASIPHSIIRLQQATHTGFEPVISTLTKWRPLQTGPMGHFQKWEFGMRNAKSHSAFPIPHSAFQRVPCENRTRLTRLEIWRLCQSAKGTCQIWNGEW